MAAARLAHQSLLIAHHSLPITAIHCSFPCPTYARAYRRHDCMQIRCADDPCHGWLLCRRHMPWTRAPPLVAVLLRCPPIRRRLYMPSCSTRWSSSVVISRS